MYPEDGNSRPLRNDINHYEPALFRDSVEDIMNYSDILNAMLRKVLQTPSKHGSGSTKPTLSCW
jgi:hypothetical protein